MSHHVPYYPNRMDAFVLAENRRYVHQYMSGLDRLGRLAGNFMSTTSDVFAHLCFHSTNRPLCRTSGHHLCAHHDGRSRQRKSSDLRPFSYLPCYRALCRGKPRDHQRSTHGSAIRGYSCMLRTGAVQNSRHSLRHRVKDGEAVFILVECTHPFSAFTRCVLSSSAHHTAKAFLLDLQNVWLARLQSLWASNSFQFNPAVQQRALVALGTLISGARPGEVEDDFMVSLRRYAKAS